MATDGAPANRSVKLVACPACNHQVSAHASNCPHCGHPMSGVTALGARWTEIKHVGGFVSAAIVTLTLGGQAGFLKLVSGADSSEGAGTLLQVFLQTAPLTIAVMLIGLALMKKWWKETASTAFFAAVVLLASLLIGSWLGGLGDVSSIHGNMGSVIFGSLAFYWRRYGPSLFLSSVILGVFLAWVLAKRAQPTIIA